jgi:phage terminase small subunit
MKLVPIENPEPADLGPAMLVLDERQRRFVVGAIRAGGKSSMARIAEAAGYSNVKQGAKVRAHELTRNQKVLAALKEESDRRLDWSAVKSILRLDELVGHKDPKVRLKAIDSVLDRRGYARQTNQQISMQVEHVDNRSTSELLTFIQSMVPKLPVIDTTAETVDAED